MKQLAVLLLLGILSHEAFGYVYVVGPNVIRFNHDETVLIGVFEETNIAVEVFLEYNGKRFSTVNPPVTVPNQASPVTRTVRVNEEDIFEEGQEEKPRSVLLVAMSHHGRQETEVLLSYNTGYLIVQTDKPIYTPRQTVKVRTLPLDESMRPANNWNAAMDLLSPSGIVMSRKRRQNGEDKFFKDTFKLPPNPETGIWTVKAFYTGQLETISRATFEVREYELPRFGVTVDVDTPYILENEKDKDFLVTVLAEYVYKKKVQGSTGLKLFLNCPELDRKFLMKKDRMQLQNGVAEFEVKGTDLFRSPELQAIDFPTGCRLEFEADVLESATGKEEFGGHLSTLFAAEKYIFDFQRSKKTFHPGMEYHLRLFVYLANGRPAENTRVNVVASVLGEEKMNKNIDTDENGYALVLVNTAQKDKQDMEIRVTSDNGESRAYFVSPYQGVNQIQVENVKKDGDMIMRAYTNIQGDSYTGMMFVIVSRGKIVHHSYMDAGTQKGGPISLAVQEKVSPSARLLVFYVDKGRGKVVADSVKFNVEPKCSGEGLSLHVPQTNANIPGGTNELTITGAEGMAVGLNVIDKALLLLKSDNVMRKSQMFNEMESHDLGCGEGGGRTSEDIFKNAGLTLIVSQTDFNLAKRDSTSCEDHAARRKRATKCYANEACCMQGFEYANAILDNSDNSTDIDPFVTCYSKARELARENELPTLCILDYYRECFNQLILSDDDAAVRSIGSRSDYEEDLKYTDGKMTFRTDFRESWLFEEVILRDGPTKKSLPFPDSITEWMIQGVGVNPGGGLCIAEPANVTVFKDFFIELDLPYKAVRMEHLDVKATIFNYAVAGSEPMDVSFYIEGIKGVCSNVQPGKQSRRQKIKLPANTAETVRFPIIPLEAGLFKIRVSAIVTNVMVSTYDAVEKELLVVNEGEELSESIQICLDPLKQMEDCQNHKRITKSVTAAGVQTIDVDLLLPAFSLPTTGMATAYLSTNIMADVVETLMDDVEKLFWKPAGCGEQTIIRLAPTVYAMAYLKQTKQMTPDIEQLGNDWIRDGVKRERTYRKIDGSYAAWLSRPSSTWLTAFVAKVFCQAKDIVDDSVEEINDIVPTVQSFSQRVNGDGSFYDSMPVIHREMIGHLQENDPSLTAFVLISMTECKSRTQDMEVVFNNAMKYIENLPEVTLRQNPYLTAISAYALARADSTKKWDFMNILMDLKQNDRNGMYWGSKGGAAQANSASIETTSYALLTCMLFDDLATSAKIVSWMTSQRDARGVFRTTQDTVIGLQALSTYSTRTHTRDTDLTVKMVANFWSPHVLKLNNEQAEVRRIVPNLPVEKDNSLSIEVKGKGTGRIMIDLRYNRNQSIDEICPFELNPIEVGNVVPGMENVDRVLNGTRKCDVCGHCIGDPDPDTVDYDNPEHFGVEEEELDAAVNMGGWILEENDEVVFGRKKREAANQDMPKRHCIKFTLKSKDDQTFGMSIINFGLVTGMTVEEEDLKKLVKEDKIARYEMPENGKGFVIFYLDGITANETSFVFRIKDNFNGDAGSRQPATVMVYDYYSPEKKCSEYYGLSGDVPVGYESCDDDKYKRNCKCLQTICARDYTDKIVQLAKNRNRKQPPPAVQLSRRTCDRQKADYSVLVEIQELDFDPTTMQMYAVGKVIRLIHRGQQKLQKNSEMRFHWRGSCLQPKLKPGKKYYIIAKDGAKTKDGEEEVYNYPLMDTAMVIEKPRAGQRDKNKKILLKVMQNYEKLMRRDSCRM